MISFSIGASSLLEVLFSDEGLLMMVMTVSSLCSCRYSATLEAYSICYFSI